MDYEVLCNRELQRRFNVSIDNVNKMRKRKLHFKITTAAIWFSKPSVSSGEVMIVHLLLTGDSSMLCIRRHVEPPQTGIKGIDVRALHLRDSVLLTYSVRNWSALYELMSRLPKHVPTRSTTWVSFGVPCVDFGEQFILHLHYGLGQLASHPYRNDRTTTVFREMKNLLTSFA